MRLSILEHGHRLRTRALLAFIRLVSRRPVVDAVKVALYRPDFYPGGPLTQEAMRGPSGWSVGDRELMAAFVSQANACRFCVAAHSATARIWYRDEAKVAAALDDLDSAPIEERLRVTLRLLAALTRDNTVSADQVREVLASGVTRHEVEDALAVCLAFNITDRLADAFDFEIVDRAAMDAGARYLLRRGYG
jgi:uncharacterized peroxidase-related enzyme